MVSLRRLFMLVGLACLLAGSSASAGELTLVIRDGRVTMTAHDVTIAQILREWARLGQTRIVNIEKVVGSPVTLEFTDVPERQALDVILRSVSGYMAAPRSTTIATASIFDRILILPTSVPPPASAPAAAFQQPTATPQPQQNLFRPVFPGAAQQTGDQTVEAEEDEEPDSNAPPNRPVFGQGVPTPGGIVPAPGMMPFGTPAPPPGGGFTPIGGDQPAPEAEEPPAQGNLPTGTAATPGVIVQPPASRIPPRGAPPRNPPQ